MVRDPPRGLSSDRKTGAHAIEEIALRRYEATIGPRAVLEVHEQFGERRRIERDDEALRIRRGVRDGDRIAVLTEQHAHLGFDPLALVAA